MVSSLPMGEVIVLVILGLGLLLGLFNKPWWSVGLAVGLAILVGSFDQTLHTLASEPAWVLMGLSFYGLPGLAGWLLGRLLIRLGG
ncbi:MAG: hypothetical protein C0420_13645 [Methylobacterium sp.]|nr:hypothetical protein [Methylobacterium sp.]